MIFCLHFLSVWQLIDNVRESACKSSLIGYYDDLKNIMRKFKKTKKATATGTALKKDVQVRYNF